MTDAADIQQTRREQTTTFALSVEGMTCAACATRLEKVLNRLTGVSAHVSFATHKAALTLVPDHAGLKDVTDAVARAGFSVVPEHVTLAVEGMTCASCSARLTKVLERQEGVSANVNLATGKAEIDFIPGAVSISDLIETVTKAGFSATVAGTDDTARKARRDREKHRLQLELAVGILLTAPLLLDMVGGMNLMLPRWIQLVLATLVQFGLGAKFYQGAWAALRGGGANMDVLVALGTTVAWCASAVITVLGLPEQVWFESGATVLTLVTAGRLMETGARNRAAAGVERLARLQPVTAHVETPQGVQDRPAASLAVGDVFVIRPGEAVPTDGVILSGESSLDEAMLTGESMPVGRGPDDPVRGGTVNGVGVLRVRAMAVGADTALARITRMVDEAEGSKAPIERLVDRISGIFVPVILAIALLTLAGGWLVTGSFDRSLINTVAVLVVACPCALGLATPTAIMVGAGRGAAAGLLFRSAEALEQTGRIGVLLMDKTGTLTEGRPRVSGLFPQDDATESSLLALAAGLEGDSSHPLAGAVRDAANARQIAPDIVADNRAVAGHGLEGSVGGVPVRLGSARFLEKAPSGEAMSAMETGQTLIGVEKSGRLLGWIAVADTIRPDAAQAISLLKHYGIHPIMVTGDTLAAARRVANTVGITDIQAEVLPGDKADAVKQARATAPAGTLIGMVGDGINDAPALASADVGIAMGSGTDVALETADVVLMRSRLLALVDAVSLSQATSRKIRQNLFFACIYNVLGVPLAAFGVLPPMLSGAAMAMSSVSVVTSALLLNRWKPLATVNTGAPERS
ncbi:heavy metal translocating P-type ATPase [Acetobacter sp.]|jgi:Cu+-exporting ATPase|uniref:heavy metal translocating P-type ATPase n=1 Tax=Acetobacter sp. TaxID=440 RepID=UPI0025C1C216|nr:heavy metal translocating P-type ATPase [Acetobacter sp.]MCH4090688.1 cadmium-translocating P-type ATPase [Acetobacter sp.]MCI1300131.1 cadmium-translocating P-type ATPase [Acetobacter sp.]MCI1316549.1 cadmium-translocating P-type ATPase [Acetobacter sp.]